MLFDCTLICTVDPDMAQVTHKSLVIVHEAAVPLLPVPPHSPTLVHVKVVVAVLVKATAALVLVQVFSKRFAKA